MTAADPAPEFPDCVPVLTDGVVRLRAHRESDAGRIVEQCQDPETLRWTTVPRPYADADARDFLQAVADGWRSDGPSLHWAIEEVADPAGRFCGTVDLRSHGGGAASTGFGLHPDARGRGLTARALRLVCRYWFDERNGVRVHWQAFRGNTASWATARACGFTYHGTLPERVPHPGGLRDDWVASVGRDDDLTTPRTPWHTPTAYEGTTVRMRAWREEDAAAVEEPDHPDYYTGGGSWIRPDNAAEWIRRTTERGWFGTGIMWCIASLEDDRPLGHMALFVRSGALDGDVAELGYGVFPSARGRGVASEAAALVVRHAFLPTSQGGLGLRRLVAETSADNEASNTVLRRAGFTVYGRERATDLVAGRAVDALHWDLLQS